MIEIGAHLQFTLIAVIGLPCISWVIVRFFQMMETQIINSTRERIEKGRKRLEIEESLDS